MNTHKRPTRTLITGGAGFIGTNLAHRLLTSGGEVVIFDNLSREGSKKNLQWLCNNHLVGLIVKTGDIRDFAAVREAVTGVDQVFHFAAQVAVTRSLEMPVEDFDINLRGTLNLLESIRECSSKPKLLFTSTNKVFGNLSQIPLTKSETRYCKLNPSMLDCANSPLDFYSPYGCSKGAADQYVLDYSRNYGLNAVVFRMSCIYGPHQYGNEDQGWVAHFMIRTLDCIPVIVFGDGCQVRDILYIDDLLNAMELAMNSSYSLSGQAFSIGGGPENTLSLIELFDQIQKLHGHTPPIQFAQWRAGDQKYYVSDTSKFTQLTGWIPQTDVQLGLEKLYNWLKTVKNYSPENKENTVQTPSVP
jgi:CDP-paratose 2-epimerase